MLRARGGIGATGTGATTGTGTAAGAAKKRGQAMEVSRSRLAAKAKSARLQQLASRGLRCSWSATAQQGGEARPTTYYSSSISGSCKGGCL